MYTTQKLMDALEVTRRNQWRSKGQRIGQRPSPYSVRLVMLIWQTQRELLYHSCTGFSMVRIRIKMC